MSENGYELVSYPQYSLMMNYDLDISLQEKRYTLEC